MVLYPEYERDERISCFREINAPPNTLFEPLGWDRDPGLDMVDDDHQAHYRRFVPMEAEKCPMVMTKETDFNQYILKRGQKRGAQSGGLFNLFSAEKKDESGQADTEESVGKFKALITVVQKD